MLIVFIFSCEDAAQQVLMSSVRVCVCVFVCVCIVSVCVCVMYLCVCDHAHAHDHFHDHARTYSLRAHHLLIVDGMIIHIHTYTVDNEHLGVYVPDRAAPTPSTQLPP